MIDAPVLVENDADAMAVGEQTAEPRCRRSASSRFPPASAPASSIGGHVYTGSDGGAGDIGHVRLARRTGAVPVRSRGCLAAVASGRAVAQQLTAEGLPAGHGRDVADLLAAGDAEAQALVREAGRRIGEVLATVVCVLNPAVLVVAGDLASRRCSPDCGKGCTPTHCPGPPAILTFA